jgi:hypothetical protein
MIFVLPVLPMVAGGGREKSQGLGPKFGGRFFEKVAAKFFWEATLCRKAAMASSWLPLLHHYSLTT